MSVKVIFSNEESVLIETETLVYAWKSDDKNKQHGYYATMVFEGSNFCGTEIGTSDPIVGLQGLFGNSDWFSVNDMLGKIYKTSSIVSLESI